MQNERNRLDTLIRRKPLKGAALKKDIALNKLKYFESQKEELHDVILFFYHKLIFLVA